jgi:death-on-curing protein
MTYVLLSPDMVEALHDSVLNPGELPGRARDKSLDSALARIENRLAYGLIGDVFDLAAAYAMAVARGHCFNDGNKRTAFRTMNAALAFNGVRMTWNTEEIGQIIIRCAQGLMEDGDLADWLRDKANGAL